MAGLPNLYSTPGAGVFGRIYRVTASSIEYTGCRRLRSNIPGAGVFGRMQDAGVFGRMQEYYIIYDLPQKNNWPADINIMHKINNFYYYFTEI